MNCKKETLYNKEDHVDYRLGYIEGVGQLCLDCWEVIYGNKLEEFNDKGVRFHFIGDLEDNRIPDENKFLMNETEQLTKNNKKLNLVFAFNYGSRNFEKA